MIKMYKSKEEQSTGEKLLSVAKVIRIIIVVVGIITFLWTLGVGGALMGVEGLLIAIFLFVVVVFVACLVHLILSAIGETVLNTEMILRNQKAMTNFVATKAPHSNNNPTEELKTEPKPEPEPQPEPEPEPVIDPTICPVCTAKRKEMHKFCAECGTKFE